jgi:hypothetical protein
LPRCPTSDERIKKMWYIDSIEYYLVVNEIMSFKLDASGPDLH